MLIGLDFDGVVTDCGKLKNEGAKRLYGVDIPPGRFKKELVVGSGLLTAEQYRELQDHIYRDREIGLLMEPVDGALGYLSKLLEDKHHIKIVTSRGALESSLVEEWMNQRRIAIPVVYVGFGNDKAKACTGLDIYADDDLDKLENLVGIVPHRFLFSWEYNQHVEVNPSIAARVDGWSELYREISRIDK